MKQKSKSQKRIELLDLVSESITQDDIFTVIDYRNKNEDQIKQFVYPHLVESLTDYLVKEGEVDRTRAKEKIQKALKWEGNVKTTINHILFMGTQNRPDMVLEINGLRIAIEFKRGEKGSDLRSGVGQSMIYSTHYDFVLYLFIDTSKDKKILNAQGGVNETEFVELLWDQFNIKFVVV
jgi:type I site-specific restriction-modification system R (restriction) subunit